MKHDRVPSLRSWWGWEGEGGGGVGGRGEGVGCYSPPREVSVAWLGVKLQDNGGCRRFCRGKSAGPGAAAGGGCRSQGE